MKEKKISELSDLVGMPVYKLNEMPEDIQKKYKENHGCECEICGETKDTKVYSIEEIGTYEYMCPICESCNGDVDVFFILSNRLGEDAIKEYNLMSGCRRCELLVRMLENGMRLSEYDKNSKWIFAFENYLRSQIPERKYRIVADRGGKMCLVDETKEEVIK